jgi:PfaB family protein
LKNFEPIAIIGQGCVLPGCFTPEALWTMVVENRVNIRDADSKDWRVDMEKVIAAPEEVPLNKNKAWHNKGGYVKGFEDVFDVSAYTLDADIIEGLDSVFKWSFHSAHAALKNAGYLGHEITKRTGLIMGNLSYPTRSFSKYFEEQYLVKLFPEWKNPVKPTEAVNRFMSGLPAILTAKAVGLQGDAFALDAACASSLYALKLACDKLHDGQEDMMLVGGVCASDQLFLHVGFTALNALSPTGQSRPFNSEANGLIPAEGAGFIVIKRLKDAVAAGDNILGVVRGIGLSNDGKQGGFLSPSQSGQVRSMNSALASSGIHPKDVSYIECHATGTSGGDSVEIKSMQDVYGKTSAIHLSSLKGNIGHTITASGIGSIIKVLGAFRHRVLPPTPNAFPLNDSLIQSGFSVGEAAVKWESKNNRVAGISNFGFGGNNAHIIIEEWNPKSKYTVAKASTRKPKVAIVAVEIQTDKYANAGEFLTGLMKSHASEYKNENVVFDAKGLSSPPSDLKFALSQQLLILQTTQQVLAQGVKLDGDTTGVFIGMGADCEINRYGFRKRLGELLENGGVGPDKYDIDNAEEAISPILNAAGVLGTMPNIPANRINNHFDLSGLGFTISCEELSGVKALEIAIKAIQNEELSTAIVGAVDISDEMMNRAALSDVLDINLPMTNAAVVLILKDHDKAVADGDIIYATISAERKSEEIYSLDKNWLLSQVGYSHASSGLLDVATAALFVRHRLKLDESNTGIVPVLENADGFAYEVNATSLFGGHSNVMLCSEPIKDLAARTTASLQIHCYSGSDRDALVKAVQENTYSQDGAHRLGIVSTTTGLDQYRHQALQLLQKEQAPTGWITPFMHYRHTKVEGEMAFVFTGAASAYPKMGKELLQEFPGLVDGLKPYCKNPGFAGEWIFEKESSKAFLPFYQLAGSSLMCQVHAGFTKHVLGLKPHAAFGLSSGETNSMFALGVWEDMDALLEEIDRSELYHSALGVDFNSVKEYWELAQDEEMNWENWRVLAPVEKVRELISKEGRVYLTIVNTKDDCVIGGDSEACARILRSVGMDKAMPLHHDIAVHCAPVKPFETIWRKLHTRKVNTVSDVRFYSNYLDGVYSPTSDTVADALTGQALQAIDFPRIVEKAYNDGVRVFVEHGPRNSLTVAIREILKDKEIVCVSLDKFGQSGVVEALRASAELWCAGVSVDLQKLSAKASAATAPVMQIKFPIRKEEITVKKIITPMSNNNITVPFSNSSAYVMERAPAIAVTKRNAHDTVSRQQLAREVLEDISGEKQFHIRDSELSHDPITSLLLQQHAIMTTAHESFLQTQLKAQEDYVSLMRNMMSNLMTAGDGQEIHTDNYVHSEDVYSAPETHVNIDRIATHSEIDSSIAQKQERTAPPRQVTENEKIEELQGPKFSRKQLETLASGKISSVFGSLFEKQDQYDVQVRMPEPPLLLCDRVTGIKGEPGTLGLGTIWTETDVTDTSWYLHNHRMPPGIFIEAGQADLLLISYLGIDFQNKGERAYRLLGCELKFYGELPKPGDTLKYEINVDGYAKSGETTLFFFHYDCHIDGKVRISVRNGQAGFFTRQELDESKGVIWEADAANYGGAGDWSMDNATKKTSFTAEEVEAYTVGDMVACFGDELAWTKTHTRSPRSQAGYQNFIKQVTVFDLKGGPAKRGYLRSDTIVSPDDWYFDGHFKNDPCMPGTLMADACLQMMAFYMVGAGLTTTRDGWRFEPVTEEKYKFICRGQVIPSSKNLTYEIFVDEIVDGEYPTLYAHVLTTVDGTKAFLCERLGLRLVPDWPLSTMPELLEEDVQGKAIASYNGFKFGHSSLINCALGRPAHAFGSDFQHYDGGLRSPRLPAPPYHFMTRIAEYTVVPGEYRNDPFVVAEYDIPENVWYFNENGTAIMPYAVLMEVALQPCGWLSTFICQKEIEGKDLLFRNLDGKAVQHRPVVSADKTIVTKTTLTGASIMDDVIILKFDVVSTSNGEPVFTMNTVFGFFDVSSMKDQKGLAISVEERANLSLQNNHVIDLRSFPSKYFNGSTARLPASKLLMIDRVVSFHPDGGKYSNGYIRSEKDVDPGEWFFKAHFFQDPVQPGSLGVEAMLQLIQFYMLEQGLHNKLTNPHFEPVILKDEVEWHYRGQVTPAKKLISVDFDVKEVIVAENIVAVIGEARLWVDGLKIYHAPKIGMRIVEGSIS